MTLPVEIPNGLQARGKPLSGVDRGLIAWDRAAALAVLESLDGTLVAVLYGEVLREIGDGHLPVDDWYCHALGKETATEFAARTRRVAAQYCRKHKDDALGPIRIVFHFTPQDAAA
jgi:hypothetical protein